MQSALKVLIVCVMALAGCGPNVLEARGKVMNPLVKNSKELYFSRSVTIIRKEPDMEGRHIIVGPQKRPRALDRLYEIAEIPDQHTDGSGLIVEFGIYSKYKHELAEMRKNYSFRIILPDGRIIKGETHRLWALRNLTDKVTGGAMRTHMTVVDKRSGTVTNYRHWEEVENEFELFWRRIRIVFRAKDLITLETPSIVVEARGEQRVRRYVFEFTTDPTELMDDEEKASYLESLKEK